MHWMRRVLQRLRRREVESGLPGTRGAQPRIDARSGRARCGRGRAPSRGRRRCRMPCLPYAYELHRALPEEHLAHGFDRGTEARRRQGRIERQALSAKAETWLWLAQRASAAILAACVAVHLVTMVYAVRGGLTGAENIDRTRRDNAPG